MRRPTDNISLTVAAGFAAAAVVVLAVACILYGCTPAERAGATQAANVALAAEQGACVYVHDTDPDAGPILTTICRAAPATQVIVDSTLAVVAQAADGGLAAVSPATVGSALSAAQTFVPPKDAGAR